MRISGTGITPFDIKIKPDFQPVTKLALRWKQASNGNFFATDRGVLVDTYDARCKLYGVQATIDNFISEIETNRAADNNVISLSDFDGALSNWPTQEIFGVNVNYATSISATVIRNGRKAQRTWKGFGLGVWFRALSPTFVTDTGSLPLLNLEIGFQGDSDVSIHKIDSYENVFSYLDHKTDIGLFKGTFVLSSANMKIFRNLLRTTRGGTFPVASIDGVSQMFGPRRGNGSGNIKVIEWKDLGPRDADRWRIRVSFAEHV